MTQTAELARVCDCTANAGWKLAHRPRISFVSAMIGRAIRFPRRTSCDCLPNVIEYSGSIPLDIEALRFPQSDIRRAVRKLIAAAADRSSALSQIFMSSIHWRFRFMVDRQSVAFNRRFLRYQVSRAMRRLGFSRAINWVFNPAAAVVAGALNEEQIIYHCVDEYSAFTGVDSAAMRSMEEQLLRQAHLVIVSAERLYASRARMNRHTVVVRHGVDFSHFRRALDPGTQMPDDIAHLHRPILGFFGLVADWIDLDLLAEIARRFRRVRS